MATKPTIIVIDDDAAMRHSLQWLISSSGYDVHSYESAKSYLDDAMWDGRPDCVISDIHMSEMTGVELHGILKKRYPNVPVIFISGQHDLSVDQARSLGSAGFFSKPLDTDAFLTSIHKAVASYIPE